MKALIQIHNFSLVIEKKLILKNINCKFFPNQISTIIGPSGSGKTTLLKSINRLNEEFSLLSYTGTIYYKNKNIYKEYPVYLLRKEIGMLFQKPVVFPTSIFENVLFGIRNHKKLSRKEKKSIVETFLNKVALYQEVKDRLQDNAFHLSVGQQQRLSLARILANEPRVLLLDEPTSSLDPKNTNLIEDLLIELKKQYTIILVTHNIKQAKRISDQILTLQNGKITSIKKRKTPNPIEIKKGLLN